MEQVIKISGARQNNLKNIDVSIPKNQLVVMTGPSGSGKSSLAFDTIYAEGQRRYVESLSSYARQFLGISDKPDVDSITGLSPAIAIEQKGANHNPRSTVGTVTEIYDYLRLLFGRAGTPHCPQCGKEVRRYSVDEIVDKIYREYGGKPLEVLSPLVRDKKGEFRNTFQRLQQQGYMHVRVDGAMQWLEDDGTRLDKNKRHTIECVIDRLRVKDEDRMRLTEAVEMALKLSNGFVLLASKGLPDQQLTEKYVCPDCGISLPDIEPRLFSFNAPYGACPDCSGLGVHLHFSEELSIDPELSLADGAFIPWKSAKYMIEKADLLAKQHGWDISGPFKDLPEDIRHALVYGSDESIPMVFSSKRGDWEYNGHYIGLIPWLQKRFDETESDTYRDELLRYRVEDVCRTCHGARLKPEVLSVTLGGYNIAELTEMPIEDLRGVLEKLTLGEREQKIVGLALTEVRKRLDFLDNVGTGYLSLSRRADTLSGGESQRIRLATQIGSQLTGVLYVLDEPTIGLHPRDTNRLLGTLRTIRDLGNSVLVVEHDRDTMLAADYIVELGPAAGENGGYLVAQGSAAEIRSGDSSTAAYLRGEADGTWMPYAERRRPTGKISVRGCRANNLKKLNIDIPLGVFTALSGVSGSGKSTLLYEVLYKGLKGKFDRDFRERPGKFDTITGYESLRNIVLVDQSPIGRTPRSNPATYTGVFSYIRELFTELPESKLRGYQPGRFSFNVRGGRCEACGGDGVTKVSMLFLPDVFVKCDVCRGTRYNRETLEVKFHGKSIADVLAMTVDEAAELFKDIPRVASRLATMQEAGLGYIRLGQSATTLSGGEAQRVKLATELGKKFRGNTLYLLDEPTTGLHYTDVKKLLKLLHKLVDQGNSVLVIEHNLDVLASADYILDLGPEGGSRGGSLVAEGTPEKTARAKTPTGVCLAGFFKDIKH